LAGLSMVTMALAASAVGITRGARLWWFRWAR